MTAAEEDLEEAIRLFEEHCKECALCGLPGPQACERGSGMLESLRAILSQPDFFIRGGRGKVA